MSMRSVRSVQSAVSRLRTAAAAAASWSARGGRCHGVVGENRGKTTTTTGWRIRPACRVIFPEGLRSGRERVWSKRTERADCCGDNDVASII